MSTWNKFTKIDLRSAYQQLVLDEESQKLCTINTHKGLFRYTRLPFGISSSSAICGTCVIMDDLLVGGTNDDEHLKNLEAVFKQFLKFGLRVKLAKCVFMAPSVIYFGLHFSEKGLQPTDEKVQAIKEAPTPRNVTELRSFLGMLAALTNFISKLSTLAHPLYQLLGNKPWNWTPACKQAFRDVKHALTSESVLAHYSPTLPMELSVDASPYGVGAVIMHVYPNGVRRPIAFASRTLNEHEKQYGQIDKEALAIMFGLKRFHLYLYGRHFTILTDHFDRPQASGTDFWSQDSNPLSGSDAFTALGNYSVSLRLQHQICPFKAQRGRRCTVAVTFAINVERRERNLQDRRTTSRFATHYPQGDQPRDTSGPSPI